MRCNATRRNITSITSPKVNAVRKTQVSTVTPSRSLLLRRAALLMCIASAYFVSRSCLATQARQYVKANHNLTSRALRKGSNMQASTSAHTGLKALRVDGHLHVWAPFEEAEKYPFVGPDGKPQPPPLAGNVELLLQNMEASGVAGALIVQPSNHGFDHSYVASVLRRFPGRFVGCALADPRPGHSGAAELRRLVQEEGFRAVRFNPYLWPMGEHLNNKEGRELYAAAGELGVPVGYMTFHGLLDWVDDIEALCREFPDTRVLMDHFGFCKAADLDSEEWRRLLGLARFPQVFVKVSAFFRVSGAGYPYQDVRPALRRLLDAFGKERLLWGSDWPWVDQEGCGYANAWRILEEGDEQEGTELFSREEKEWLLGKTAMALFPGSFQGS